MSSFLYNSQSMLWGNVLCVQDEDKCDLWKSRMGFVYQMRGVRSNRDHGNFFTLWPRSRMTTGDPNDAGFLGGQDPGDGGMFEPVALIEGGSSRLYFIHGVCVDGAGAPLAAAVVELYLTATDTIVATGTTDSNGIYSLGTPYNGQNHKIYANYGPNTLVGGSVDTLVPVLSPW